VKGGDPRDVVRYCPVCDGFEARDKTVAVLGDEDATRESLLIRSFTKDVLWFSTHAEEDMPGEARSLWSINLKPTQEVFRRSARRFPAMARTSPSSWRSGGWARGGQAERPILLRSGSPRLSLSAIGSSFGSGGPRGEVRLGFPPARSYILSDEAEVENAPLADHAHSLTHTGTSRHR
jgi:hypothetical protein